MNCLKRYTALLLCVLMLISFAACGKGESYSVIEKGSSVLEASAAKTKKSHYVSHTDKSKLSLIASSDMTELYYDKINLTVSAYDKASGTLWSSLPTEYSGTASSVLSLEVLVDGNFYTLTSQRDSFAAGGVAFDKDDKSMTVIYSFEKETDDSKKISLSVPVIYSATGGGLSVEVDCGQIVSKGQGRDIAVTGLSILPWFAAGTSGKKGDFILLPDGCGLVVDLSENPEEFRSISLDVYGEKNQAVVGCFGMKRGNSAFVALIEQGDEISEIRMEKALASGGVNRVYPFFRLRQTQESKNSVLLCDESYNGKIRVHYRFLSSDSASYMGMAGVVRELLVRNSVLFSDDEKSEEYPFNLSLVINKSTADSKGRYKRENRTTLEQATEILSSMKAKGFGAINVRLEGIVREKDSGKLSLDYGDSSAGRLEEFISYCENQGISVYADSELLTFAQERDMPSAEFFGQTVIRDSRVCLSPDRISERMGNLLSFVRDKQLNLCINDSGVLYADSGSYTHSEVKELVSSQTAAAAAHKSLMLTSPVIYAMKYADMVVELPMTASNQNEALCTRVPFVQGVLHGVVPYSLSAVNSAENEERAILRAVEYGSVLYYRWQGSDYSTQEKADSLYYMNSLTQAQTAYERMSAAFGDLSDARITDHYAVSKGVYYTEYDTSTGIYVNYNKDAVTVNGVTVEGMSYLRVN